MHHGVWARAAQSALRQECIVQVVAAFDGWFDPVGYELSNPFKDKRLRIIPRPSVRPVGVAGVRNIAISEAVTDWILPLDADDEFVDGGPQALWDALGKRTQYVKYFAYGDYLEDFNVVKASAPHAIRRKNICQATMLFHKNDWFGVGGYSPDFNISSEDWAFTAALMEAGVTPVRVDSTIHRYNRRDGARHDTFQRYRQLVAEMLVERYPQTMTGRAYDPQKGKQLDTLGK